MPIQSNRALDVLLSGGTSLSLPEDLPIADWHDIGIQLGRAGTQLSWLVGDWWAFGEAHYGQRKAIVEADDWTGPAYQTCMNMASVCRAFQETSRRREGLSFGHHEVVAIVPAEIADQLLDWCLEDVAEGGRPRSIRDLRLKRDAYLEEHSRKQGQARRDEANGRSQPTMQITVITSDPHPQPPARFVYVAPSAAEPKHAAPEIALDTSGGGGPIPPELAELSVEPPEYDRIGIARAALNELPDDLRLELLGECAAELGYRLVK